MVDHGFLTCLVRALEDLDGTSDDWDEENVVFFSAKMKEDHVVEFVLESEGGNKEKFRVTVERLQ